jgi:nicotinamide-nucleotide amidase
MLMAIEVEVGALLGDRGLTLATAESSTGGLVAHRITSVSGSSAYYLGGFVTYANEAKEALVGVKRDTLIAHGAVSEETAREMARGARERLGADVGIATTGIAGPTGGTPEKPVGLVYVALSAADAELCQRHVWQGERAANNEESAEAALRLIQVYLRKRRQVMVEFVNEVVTVETQVRRDGTVRPNAFVWRGRRFQITSWGREGSTTRDGRACYYHLVQTPDLESWELCQDTEMGEWTLARRWPRGRRAV